LGTLFYHAQKKIDEFFEGHFPFPGEVLRAFTRPVEKSAAFDQLSYRFQDFPSDFTAFFPILSSSLCYTTTVFHR
jgi:hypothetical protein